MPLKDALFSTPLEGYKALGGIFKLLLVKVFSGFLFF